MSDARFIWASWISHNKKKKNKNIKLHMCFKNGKQHQINNCLDYKLINWSLGSLYTYVKNNLSNIKEITDTT